MTTQSEIIRANPIGEWLDWLRDMYSLDAIKTDCIATDNKIQELSALRLLSAVLTLPASLQLPSKRGNRKLFRDIATIISAVHLKYYDLERFKPLADAVFNHQSDEVIWDAVYELIPPFHTLSSSPLTPWSHNTGSLANSIQHRKYVDAPDGMQSISTNASFLCCPFFRLPPEIRCMVYRVLLLSHLNIRMVQAVDVYLYLLPNNLYPSILGTCRLIYQEAHHVLYGENLFLAHRIDRSNPNAALIRRARYIIGSHGPDEGEDQARGLSEFMVFQKELKFIELEFRFDLLEDPSIYELARQAIRGHRNLANIEVFSSAVSSRIVREHYWRLRRMVRDQALILEWLRGGEFTSLR